tara:strand:- start:5560 stop:5700 length:141 start_codon:yes stop_codon:yes gene_type:complete
MGKNKEDFNRWCKKQDDIENNMMGCLVSIVLGALIILMLVFIHKGR